MTSTAMERVPYTKTVPLLKIDNVCLSFGDRMILRDVQAEIRNIVRQDCKQGQVVGFLGPSGIGKSQLARIIAGLQPPTSGTVTLGENGTPTRKGLVGMVAQNYILFDYATVIANLLIAGRQAGLSSKAAIAKADGYIQAFGLESYVNMYPKQLSGGTRQRVAIIQQLMCSEHLLIMDEPFSGLDLIMKARACKLITDVSLMDELNTIIVVTHDVTEAASISDTLWLMGHEQNENGEYLQGARLVRQYDLAEMGLCWHPDITSRRDFIDFVADVKEEFSTLTCK